MKSGDYIWLSSVQLALLGRAGVIDFPRSDKNAREKARSLGWESREIECRGGKKGYMSQFQPPDNVLEVIQSFLKENPDFFTKAKSGVKDKSHSKPYPVSKATALTLKSPEHHPLGDYLDPLLMHHVMVAVDEMLKKHGKVIDSRKKADLVFLIHDCCKAAGGMDEAIVERFVSVTG